MPNTLVSSYNSTVDACHSEEKQGKEEEKEQDKEVKVKCNLLWPIVAIFFLPKVFANWPWLVFEVKNTLFK